MAMDHPKISIITTVYKTGHYLPLTVQSILAQTFTDFELLLVDDGSPDNSGEVADALAKTDARIRVFHKENGGPASASNMGLDNARGDYIGFVDSDDLITPDMYEKLYAAVQAPGVRLAACAGDCIDEDGSKIEGRVVTSDLRGVHDAQELLLDAFKTGTSCLMRACLKTKASITMKRCFLVTTPACCTACLRVRDATAWVIRSTITAPARGRSPRPASRRASWMTCACTGIGCNILPPNQTARNTSNGPRPATGGCFTSSGANPARLAI